MKKGAFIDKSVEDPRKGNPDFGKIKASAEGYAVERYLANQRIIKELGKEYKLEIYSELLLAASMIANRNKDYSLDFMISNIPPWKEAEELAKERSSELRRRLRGLGVKGREAILKQIMEEEGWFINKIYSTSLWCLETLHKDLPDMIIIAYTDAPESIRRGCLDENRVDHVIHRERWGIEHEINEIKRLIEADKYAKSSL